MENYININRPDLLENFLLNHEVSQRKLNDLLRMCCSYKLIDFVQLLIKYGANVNCRVDM